MHDSYCLYSLSHSAMVEISVMLISTILLCDIILLLFLLLFLYMFNFFFYMYMDRVSAIKIYYYYYYYCTGTQMAWHTYTIAALEADSMRCNCYSPKTIYLTITIRCVTLHLLSICGWLYYSL